MKILIIVSLIKQLIIPKKKKNKIIIDSKEILKTL